MAVSQRVRHISQRVRKLLDEVALTLEDYDSITADLGREPNDLEIEIYGSLWSEHSGYRYSKPLLVWILSQAP